MAASERVTPDPVYVEVARKWLRDQVENMRFMGDFRPDHAASLATLLTEEVLKAAAKAQLHEHGYYCERCGKSWPCSRRKELEAAANGR